MIFKQEQTKDRNNALIRLTRTQLEQFQKGVNKLLASTKQESETVEVELDGSDDIITIERM